MLMHYIVYVKKQGREWLTRNGDSVCMCMRAQYNTKREGERERERERQSLRQS